jgi:hypothetical protein
VEFTWGLNDCRNGRGAVEGRKASGKASRRCRYVPCPCPCPNRCSATPCSPVCHVPWCVDHAGVEAVKVKGNAQLTVQASLIHTRAGPLRVCLVPGLFVVSNQLLQVWVRPVWGAAAAAAAAAAATSGCALNQAFLWINFWRSGSDLCLCWGDGKALAAAVPVAVAAAETQLRLPGA